MYQALYQTTVLTLSPTSEYSSDSSLFSFNLADLDIMPEEHTPSPPPSEEQYPYNCPPLTDQEAASTAEAASHARFLWGSDDYQAQVAAPRHPYTSRVPPPPYHLHQSSYDHGYVPSSSGAFAPSSSANHRSLPSLSHPATSRDASYPLPGFSTIDGSFDVGYGYDSQSPIHGARDEYPLGTGVGTAGAPQQDNPYGLDLGSAGGSNQAGPIRTTRNRHTTAPYTSVTSSASRRVNDVPASAYRELEAGGLAPSLTIDSLLTSPRRSSRNPRKAIVTPGVPLEKNFVCKTCDARFARNHDLTRHHKVHDPVKQFRCTGCDRSFTRKDALKRHATQKKCGNEDWQDVVPTPLAATKSKRKSVAGSMPSIDGAMTPSPIASTTPRTRHSLNGPPPLIDSSDYYTGPQTGHQSGSTFASPIPSRLPTSQQPPQHASSSSGRRHQHLRSAPDYLGYSNANGSHHSS